MTITSKIGFGSKTSGKIAIFGKSSDLTGKVVVCLDFVGREFLEKAGLVGVAGVILPSIHWRDFEYFKKLNEFPILILLKFGKLELSADLREKLSKLDGKDAMLDGEHKTLTV